MEWCVEAMKRLAVWVFYCIVALAIGYLVLYAYAAFTGRDLQRIRETIPTVYTIVPSRILRKKVWNIGRRVDCDVIGTLPIYAETRNFPVAMRSITGSGVMNWNWLVPLSRSAIARGSA